VIYADTSVLVSLYLPQSHTPKALHWIQDKHHDETVLLTSFQRVELNNAFRLIRFREGLKPADIQWALKKFNENLKSDFFDKKEPEWLDVFEKANQLSEKFTVKSGIRTLDLLHVALAQTFRVDLFLSFDLRQRSFAKMTGLKVKS
jgi:predicted nucleic acid-binding protein